MIAAARARYEWSQRKLAEYLGVHRVTLAMWETGATRIPAEYLSRVAAQLELDLWELEVSQGKLPAELVELIDAAAVDPAVIVRALRRAHRRIVADADAVNEG